ncbi:cytochrome b/b6 domain-containing protein [Bradyrhizobium sp. CB2312]|uniref:cytochrome b/b6 domain-containing protein n=1 Tax=Bradyrhizobium sp. CB2312 TaxID=3039155 RepID=UPI0024B10722|nr:cytochrome b/b6 domain-containing protein [Bradyrhizobium sp. CB2312]WFU75091.1 cytochrome b/b6 domain-containing protein [Bradyrhizobium sp. CB2312]
MIYDVRPTIDKYPAALRILLWVRALLILGLIAAGWTMTVLDDALAPKFNLLYPWHKSFGVLVFLIVLAQLAIRAMSHLRRAISRAGNDLDQGIRPAGLGSRHPDAAPFAGPRLQPFAIAFGADGWDRGLHCRCCHAQSPYCRCLPRRKA